MFNISSFAALKPLIGLAMPLLIAGCKIVVEVPEGGRVITESGSFTCKANQRCEIDVTTTDFDETFIAVADDNFQFLHWEQSNGYFCGGNAAPCHLYTTTFGSNNNLLNVLASDREFYLVPVFGPAENYKVSGTVTVVSGLAVDSDINDEAANYSPNDNFNQAQEINNGVWVQGYSNQPNEGPSGRSFNSGDINDVFSIALTAGQNISLQIADVDNADLDLYLYNSSQQLVDSSEGVGDFEYVQAQQSGHYFINVQAYSGASNYLLQSNASVSRNTSGSLRLSSNFVIDQAIVKNKSTLSTNNDAFTKINSNVQSAAKNSAQLVSLNIQQLDVIKPTYSTNTASTSINRRNSILGQFANKEDELKWQTLQRIKQLRTEGEVVYAEPNYIRKPLLTPNDPLYDRQWHYPGINLPTAWDITTGSNNVVVSVIDTGVLLDHPDLEDQLVDGYDFISDPDNAGDGDGIDPDPYDVGDEDESFHGTHVAGTVGADSNNGIGVAGVSWQSKIMPIRALGIEGGTDYDIMQGMLYSAGLANDSGKVPSRRADIVNMSLGGPGGSQAFQDAVWAVRAAGVVIIAAAGNENTSELSYPASYDGVISVSATDLENNLAPYSNFGDYIDVAAPGGNLGRDVDNNSDPDGVLSTLGEKVSEEFTHGYAYSQGTSMATPHMAGVVALMKAVNSDLTPIDIDNLLESGSITNDAGVTGRDNLYGYGIIDALRAVNAARNYTAPPPSPIIITPGSVHISGNSADLIISLNPNVATVTPVVISSVTSNDSWLSIAARSVNAQGIGSYGLSVDRTGLAEGSYTTEIVVSYDGTEETVNASMEVINNNFASDDFTLYIALINEQTDNILSTRVNSVGGVYPYTFDAVPAGEYTLFVTTDIDATRVICDSGELCGARPNIDNPLPFTVDQDLNDIDV